MEKLLKEKLEAAKELRSFTMEIKELSLKTDYTKVNSMIEERQQYIEKINILNAKINNENNSNALDTEGLKKEIREVFMEISQVDNFIRNNINNELKIVKKNLNQPEASTYTLNIKA